eukprot:365990-Chlamydomonas_euryale.AAC.29
MTRLCQYAPGKVHQTYRIDKTQEIPGMVQRARGDMESMLKVGKTHEARRQLGQLCHASRPQRARQQRPDAELQRGGGVARITSRSAIPNLLIGRREASRWRPTVRAARWWQSVVPCCPMCCAAPPAPSPATQSLMWDTDTPQAPVCCICEDARAQRRRHPPRAVERCVHATKALAGSSGTHERR